MGASVFGSRLDLLVRLVDTTTGAAVEERNVLFMRNGQSVRPEARDEGLYIFINTGREDFLMQLKVYGYEEVKMPIKYELLNERLPEVNVFLIPSENMMKGERLLSFSGTLPFLEAIEAVKPDRVLCTTKGFVEKTRVLTYFAQSGSQMEWDESRYGLLRADRTGFEEIEIVRRDTSQSVQLKEALKEDCTANLPILRIVHGQVDEDGTFLMRVRDDEEDQNYLVRYTVKGEVRFQTVDFRNPDKLG